LDKQCPAIILSPDIRNSLANDLIIVPYSTTARRMTWHVQLRRGEAGLPQADLIDRLASSWRIIAAMANPLRWSAIAENVSSPVAVASGEPPPLRNVVINFALAAIAFAIGNGDDRQRRWAK